VLTDQANHFTGQKVSLPSKRSSPWLLVAEGIHRRGGMDKANAALAEYLSSQGRRVHLVAFSIDADIATLPGVATSYATMPARSSFLGRFYLGRLGRMRAREISREFGDVRVVVNGTNCRWPDINWVHWVHHCWNQCDREAPVWLKLKNQLDTSRSLRAERTWFGNSRLFLANSERTRRDLIELLGIEPQLVQTIYLGSDSEWKKVTPQTRETARAWLEIAPERPLVAFVGAFGYDSRKGFDTLWRAWTSLCRWTNWDAYLVVAGGGRTLAKWQAEIARAGFAARVRFLGFTNRISDVLAASDLLVSPVRYESYGLNVHEALSFGVPAIVSAGAGVAERFSPEVSELLLPDSEDANDLAARMLRWRSDIDGWKRQIIPTVRALRAYTWDDMSRRIVSLTEQSGTAWA
jgi:glycosyltransferase involved in cell wall biosynthesis